MIRRNSSLFVAFVILLGLHTAPALAVNPDEMLANPKLENRARDISQELRCLVCQNQSIDDSDADLARDLRILVRERLVAGDTDEEVIDYIVERYGDYGPCPDCRYCLLPPQTARRRRRPEITFRSGTETA